MRRSEFLRLVFAASVASSLVGAATKDDDSPRKLVLIAGPPSHPPRIHEFRAGTILLEKRLQKVPGLVVDRHEMGWVKKEDTFDDADAVVCFSDGNGRHPVLAGKGRLDKMESLVSRGMGFGCMHFAVEVPKDTAAPKFRKMIGGCYEHEWSCNPIWDARFDSFPEHPITRGIKPFSIRDEWYFNMRFTKGFGAEGPSVVDGIRFTPILVASPADDTRDGPYVYPRGPYPHIKAAKGKKEALMWAVERPDGGR
ncbi:MAG: ThuA domain-containing protein, partial [Planctomycetota bacterium]